MPNSSMAVRLRNVLQHATGPLGLPVTLLLEQPTVRSVVSFMQKLVGIEKPALQSDRPAPSASAAVITLCGFACRLPGGVELMHAMRRVVASGHDAATPVSHESERHIYAVDRPELADTALFSLSANEAMRSDPQVRPYRKLDMCPSTLHAPLAATRLIFT